MDESIKYLQEKFYIIKENGWHESIRNGSTGIGATFEKLLGLEENNLEFPDLVKIEIKTQRDYSDSHITLFNSTPEGSYYREIERLKNCYGYPDKILTSYKVLNNSIYASNSTVIGNNFLFKLCVNKKTEKIILKISDIFMNQIEDSVYWSFDLLEEKLKRKLKYVAFIYAKRKFLNGKEYFYYYKMDIYKLKSFEDFLNLIEDGIIRVTFKIGVFRSGARIGQIHDHGTGFTIHKKDLNLLFDEFTFE